MTSSRLLPTLLAVLGATFSPHLSTAADAPIDLGSRRELFVDEFLIAQKTNLELRLHSPVPKEVVLTRDAPWEGSGSDFETIIRDGDVFRMWYMGMELTNKDGTKLMFNPAKPDERRDSVVCYAESRDGIHWTKPELGLFEFNGSKKNNIVWAVPKLDNFTPFKDANPDARPDEKYKAVSEGPGGLYGLKSADGIHWTRISEKPIITRGKFDTQNNAFWDPIRKHYWCYIRSFHGPDGKITNDTKTGVRDVQVATSKDFLNWTETEILSYPNSRDEALYTNAIQPYYRAPHLFVGFPGRYIDRPFSAAAMRDLPDSAHRQARMKFSPRYGTVITDALFMTSRDGRSFNRWGEAFLRPGPQRKDNWVYGDGFISLGMFESPAEDPTAEPELTLYAHDDHWKLPTRVRRYTIRIDGFVSLNAKLSGGEMISKPITFSGRKLTFNFATSAAGSIRVELQGANGKALPGYSLAECDELFGDTLNRTVSWGDRSDLSALAGKPVRLKLVLSDADLYSLKFEP